MPPRRACDVCSKRKIRCCIPDSGGPCDWCSHHDLECTFERESQKGQSNGLTPDAVSGLVRRVEQLEEELARARSQTNSSFHSPPTSHRQASSESTDPRGLFNLPATSSLFNHAASPSPYQPTASPLKAVATNLRNDTPKTRVYPVGHSWYSRGVNLLSDRGREWMSSKVGQPFDLSNFALFHTITGNLPSTPPQHVPQKVTRNITSLPPEEETRSLLNFYNRNHGSTAPKLIDSDLFLFTIKEAYKSTERSSLPCSQQSAISCVWAFHALMGLWPSLPVWAKHAEDRQLCYEKLLSSVISVMETATLENLCTALILQLCASSMGRLQLADSLHATTSRMAYELGEAANSSEGTDPQGVSDESDQFPTHKYRRHVRFLFFYCYQKDKDLALHFGRFPVLTVDFFDLTVEESLPLSHFEERDSLARKVQEAFVMKKTVDMRLATIKEDACKLLRSRKASEATDGEILLNIRHLDDKLEDWRLSTPSEHRPSLSISSDCRAKPRGLSEKQNIRRILLQLDYHYMVSVIHASVRRCQGPLASDGSLPEDLHKVIHSSVDISLEANRSSLAFLSVPIQVLGKEAILFMRFYASVAAMSLFVNIVIHASDPKAQEDLQVLVAAVGTIQKMPLSGMSNHEMEQVQELCEFIMELGRLGNSAIWKAKREA